MLERSDVIPLYRHVGPQSRGTQPAALCFAVRVLKERDRSRLIEEEARKLEEVKGERTPASYR